MKSEFSQNLEKNKSIFVNENFMEGDFKNFEDNLFNSIKQAEDTSIEVLKNNLTPPA